MLVSALKFLYIQVPTRGRRPSAGESSSLSAARDHSEPGHQRRSYTRGLCGLHVDQHRRQQHERRAALHSGGHVDADY